MTYIEEEINYPKGSESYLVFTLKAQMEEMDDGIGPYEFWGMKGYDSNKYIGCADIFLVNEELFTKEEQKTIFEYIEDNYNELEDKLAKKYKK